MISAQTTQGPTCAGLPYLALTEPPLDSISARLSLENPSICWHAAPGQYIQAGCSILLAEDDQDCAKVLEHSLRRSGFSVRIARSGREVLPLIADVMPELILMDWWMPDLDGLACTRQLKQLPQARHIPVIAMTAHSCIGARACALRAGCDGFLSKPIPIDQLLAEIRRLLPPGAKTPLDHSSCRRAS